MSPAVRVASWLALIAVVTLPVGCLVSGNGYGRVSGHFFVKGCRPSGDLPPGPYAYEADRLATNRVENVLEIIIQEHHVDLEESDGLLVRLGDVRELRALAESGKLPIVRQVSEARTDVNVALSLFDTCPDRPTLHATSGTITFEKYRIAARPEDTG